VSATSATTTARGSRDERHLDGEDDLYNIVVDGDVDDAGSVLLRSWLDLPRRRSRPLLGRLLGRIVRRVPQRSREYLDARELLPHSHLPRTGCVPFWILRAVGKASVDPYEL
jgi:hypothetical protein